MKKILWVVSILGLVAISVSGCTREELPAQKESEPIVQIPAPKAAPEVAIKTDAVEASVQEAVKGLADLPTIEGVTSAVQSSTQAAIREGSTIVGGVTSAAQASSQAAQQSTAGVAGTVEGDVTNLKEEAVSDPLSTVPQNPI